MSWKVETVSPEQFISRKQPAHVRVTRTGGTRVDLAQPRISGDSLVGMTGVMKDRLLSLPLSEVKSVAVEKLDAGKTVLAVSIPVLVISIIYLVSTIDIYCGVGC